MARRKLWKGCYFKILVCATVVFIFWTVVGYLFTFHDEDFPEDVMYDVFIDETREDHKHIPLDQEIMEELRKLDLKRQNGGGSEDGLPLQDPSDPIIMWWTEFTREPGITRDCGDNSCFFTNNRKYRDHKNMKVFMFYGTDFSPDDLPLPRADNHEWALFHEESPKNNYILCHEPVISLFNYTSTFRRESHFPISTQHLLSLDWLLQSTYTKTVAEKNRYQEEEGLALIVYVQSDCDPPSDRDEYVKQLMKHISVDSYGGCLNNRKLPQQIAAPLEGMAHKEFFELLSRYKFALAMENAVCNDYMTEKMWRPLMVGAVPIIFGSSKVKDFLPSNKSALLLQEFKSPEHLAMVIKNLNENEVEYEKLRKWKTSGISNTFLFDTMSSRTWAPDDE
ncbi:alpha-(1,3)-fucosyltransferase 10 [Aplysia californica]|uniref:Fucosyltransferase n=1 Tax=Aplysia californica TaxID=6500 RepID=A0ABM0ZW63_APLCA|nr:alpha-(1,3)-fucosyltransferase 10 [Aplysia californica]